MWEILDQVLQSLDFSSNGHAAFAEQLSSAHPISTEVAPTKLIMLLGDIPESLSLRRQHAGALNGEGMAKSQGPVY